MFAYPTADGAVDTVQWQGFREGVDDVRYVATLTEVTQRARKNRRLRQLAEEAARWFSQIDPSGDLDEVRHEVVGWLLRLRQGK